MAEINGTPGNDSLDGTDGDDRIDGGAGDDILRGGAGNDTLIGGDGDDQAYGEDGYDRFIGGGGNDTYVGGSDSFRDLVSYQYAAAGVVVDLSLSMDHARSSGTTDAAAIGVDQLIGISDVRGSRHADFLVGDGGGNRLYGGDGNDNLSGGDGADLLEGGQGDDFLNGGAGADAASYSDSSVGVRVSLSLAGPQATGAGSDALVDIENLYGSSHDDVLIGSSGNNVLSGAAGADAMLGGLGDDIYYVDDAGDQAAETSADGGTDRVFSSVSFNLAANVENLTLTGTGATTGSGNSLNNSITGNSGSNVLNGGAGADIMSGGLGSDTYYVDDAGDQVFESSSSGGTDRVFSSVSFNLGPNIEKLTLTGTASTTGIGNALNNSITGNSGNNVLYGGAGADIMIGGLGDDIYYVDNAGDQVFEASSTGGTDRVFSSVSFNLWPNVENLTLTGTAEIDGIGNALNNSITGNSGTNVLYGGAGADIMSGGEGNDIYYVDNTGDQVFESSVAPGNVEQVFSSVSFTLSANVENLTLTGTAAINGTGNSHNNRITGNSGDNVLDGGSGGYDTLAGGHGDDTYYASYGGGIIYEASDAGTDQVFSLSSFVLTANVENLTLIGTYSNSGVGNDSNNIITGNIGHNTLRGNGGSDVLSAGDGDDSLYGGSGNDLLTGGAGADDFVFHSELDAATNVDRIVDFSVDDDTILLSETIFSGAHSIGPGQFRTGTVAEDSDDLIIYDSATGNIYYDADGSGDGAQVLFAQVDPGTPLTYMDFDFGGSTH